jgi:hypothetical protein
VSKVPLVELSIALRWRAATVCFRDGITDSKSIGAFSAETRGNFTSLLPIHRKSFQVPFRPTTSTNRPRTTKFKHKLPLSPLLIVRLSIARMCCLPPIRSLRRRREMSQSFSDQLLWLLTIGGIATCSQLYCLTLAPFRRSSSSGASRSLNHEVGGRLHHPHLWVFRSPFLFFT